MSKYPTPKSPQYFTVRLEAQAPFTLTYRVLAEDAEAALAMVLKNPLTNLAEAPKPQLSKMKRLKATLFKAGSSLIEFTKKL